MASTTTANMTPDSLSKEQMPYNGFPSLSTEMKLNVFSQLSTPQIQCMRRVCKDFRALVDEPTNTSLLIGERRTRQIQRLQSTVRDAMDYDKCSIGFVEAFKRFFTIRGVHGEPHPWSGDYINSAHFIYLWMFQHPHETEVRFSWSVAENIVDLLCRRLDLIGDPGTPASGCRRWPDCQEFLDWIDGLEKLGAYDIDDTVLEEFYYVVDAGMLDHIPRIEKAAPEAYIATDPLPSSPSWGQNVFSYCVRNKWARETVHKAINGEKDPTELQKVDVLEMMDLL